MPAIEDTDDRRCRQAVVSSLFLTRVPFPGIRQKKRSVLNMPANRPQTSRPAQVCDVRICTVGRLSEGEKYRQTLHTFSEEHRKLILQHSLSLGDELSAAELAPHEATAPSASAAAATASPSSADALPFLQSRRGTGFFRRIV